MRKKRRLKPRVRMLITFVVAIVLFGYVSFCVINYSFSKKKYELEEARLEEELHSLKNKETDLNQEISKLKDDDYLARYAREEYLYSKDGEYVIKIEDEEEDKAVLETDQVKMPEYVIILNTLIVATIIAGIILIVIKSNKSKNNGIVNNMKMKTS